MQTERSGSNPPSSLAVSAPLTPHFTTESS